MSRAPHPGVPEPIASSPAQGSLLAAAINARATHLCLLETVSGETRVVAWQSRPRQGERHLGAELAGACRHLGRQLGRRLWDEDGHRPLLASPDATRHPPIGQLAISLSPLPPLRVWLAGLSAGYSLAAAQQAAEACLVEVVGVSAWPVTLTGDDLSAALAAELPDVVLLSGGYDQDGADSLLPVQQLATLVGNALLALPARARPPILYAGNHFAAPELQARLAAVDLDIAVIPNLMPAPGVVHQGPLVRALNRYAAQLVQELDGYPTVQHWHTSPTAITSMETNFIRLTQSLAALENLTDLHAVYLGERTLHVWSAEGRDGPMLRTTAATRELDSPDGWPPIQMLSGAWPADALPAELLWWDRAGLAPVIASLAPVAPAAVHQALTLDILRPPA